MSGFKDSYHAYREIEMPELQPFQAEHHQEEDRFQVSSQI